MDGNVQVELRTENASTPTRSHDLCGIVQAVRVSTHDNISFSYIPIQLRCVKQLLARVYTTKE